MMRIGGLATGMDIDTLVKQLMTAERIPLDKLFQKKQTTEWQRDAYRDINLSLSKFRDAYAKLRLESTFLAYGVTSTGTGGVTGKATSAATPGTYEVIVDKLAKVASMNSSSAIQNPNSTNSVSGTGAVWTAAARSLAVDGLQMENNDTLTIGDVTVEFYNSHTDGGAPVGTGPAIDIYDSEAGKLKDNKTIAAEIAKLDFGDSVKVKASSGKLTVTASALGPDGNSIETSYNGAQAGVANTGFLENGSTIGTLKIDKMPSAGDVLTINGQDIEFYSSLNGGTSSNPNSIDIHGKTTNQIAEAIRGLSINGVTLGGAGNEVTIDASDASVTTSMNASAKSSDYVLKSGESETFTISNSQGLQATITVTSADTYGSLARKISQAKDDTTNESLGLQANFDDTTSRFFISTKEMGANQWFEFEGTSFVQQQIFGSEPDGGETTFRAAGQDAEFTFNGIEVKGQSSNEVLINGINLTLKEASGTPQVISVDSDTESIFNAIKDFVESYNELIDGLNAKLNEPKYRDFPPLTSEQRSELSDKEAEQWDEKAQSGLLRNDQTIRSLLDSLRQAMYEPIDGIDPSEINQIAKLGITTGDYSSGGKLVLNEDKLREALATKPDEVARFFTKVEEVAGKTSQMGLGSRIYASIGDSLDKLKEKAGIPGYTTGDNSLMGKSLRDMEDAIRAWEDKLTVRENRYWQQFTAMEKAIDRMNQQSAWLVQSFLG